MNAAARVLAHTIRGRLGSEGLGAVACPVALSSRCRVIVEDVRSGAVHAFLRRPQALGRPAWHRRPVAGALR